MQSEMMMQDGSLSKSPVHVCKAANHCIVTQVQHLNEITDLDLDVCPSIFTALCLETFYFNGNDPDLNGNDLDHD